MTRILIVDDDAAIRRLVAAVLKREKHETEEAADGQQAIEKLAVAAYDVIFLDLMMPVLDGHGVLEYLADHHPKRKCVVIMTAAGTRGVKHLDHSCVFTVLHKPFDIDDIMRSTAECLQQEGAS